MVRTIALWIRLYLIIIWMQWIFLKIRVIRRLSMKTTHCSPLKIVQNEGITMLTPPEANNKQQHEGSGVVAFKVSLKSLFSYFVVVCQEIDSDYEVDLSAHINSEITAQRVYDQIVANIQETGQYIISGFHAAGGTYQKSIVFKRVELFVCGGNNENL